MNLKRFVWMLPLAVIFYPVYPTFSLRVIYLSSFLADCRRNGTGTTSWAVVKVEVITTNPTTMDDAKLISQNSTPEMESQKNVSHESLTDNERACKELYLKHRPELVSFVIGMLDNADLANEIVNDVFLHIWENNKTVQIQQMDHPKSYLFRSVRNKCLDHLKKTGTERKEGQRYMTGLIDRQDESFSEQWSIREKIAAAMGYLTEQQKLAVLSIRFQGKTHEETAAEMGISASTVKKHLKVALSKLRRRLKDLYVIAFLFSLLT